jgi:hypothetical protein
MNLDDQSVRIRLQKKVICPNCWSSFAPEDVLWLAQHSELMKDPRLGENQALRFLPTRFTAKGEAIDPRGLPCSELACPNCHLLVPRAMLELPTCFWSILGSPACGKSYFLASMCWTLRKQMPQLFASTFNDVDPLCNEILNEYENLLFRSNASQLVSLDKTERAGRWYNAVLFGDRRVFYPKPFLFLANTLPAHPNHDGQRRGRVLCLYDNAGEHFLAGSDDANNPATRHMACSLALFFLYDPMQEQEFRHRCRELSDDPQLQQDRAGRQEAVLQEAANRVRRFTGIPEYERHDRPLLVLVSKYDVWHRLLADKPIRPPLLRASDGRYALDEIYIRQVSDAVRKLLWKYAPEFVSTAESFAQKVYYFPVSATGTSPEPIPGTGGLGVRAGNVSPIWVDVPMLFAISQFTKAGLISRCVKGNEPSYEDRLPPR